MKKQILCLFTCLLFVYSCKKDEYVHPDYIVFGSFGGFCQNDCRYVFYLDSHQLLEDTTQMFYQNKSLTAFHKKLSDEKFNIAKDLLHKVPLALTKSNKTTFIDINIADQPIYYAQILLDGRTYSWTFDNLPNSTPAYLKTLSTEILRINDAIR